MAPKSRGDSEQNSNPPQNRNSSAIDSVLNGKGDCDENMRRQIKEIYFDGNYYDITEWLSRHPGGLRILNFYTESGEDATSAVHQFHFRSKSKVMKMMGGLQKRTANQNQNDPEFGPFSHRHIALSRDFEKLRKELESEGFFEPSPLHLVYRLVEILSLLTVSVYLIMMGRKEGSLLRETVGILLVALFCGRCGWIQHEGGHLSLTGKKNIDNFIQTLSFGLGLGLSSSWWRNQHNRHHAMPQRMERDVDLETLPLVAFNDKILGGSKGGGNFLIRHQALLFITVDTMLVALFWKFYLHPRHILRRHKYSEISCILLHFVFFFSTIGFWPYIFGTWLGSIYLFGNFSLSHTHLPVTDEPLHWVEYGLIHTQDVDSEWCPWLCDWWMGFLNSQIEHHLFPTMPEFRNRQVKQRVKALARKHGIPYKCTSYWEAVNKTYWNLLDVSKKA